MAPSHASARLRSSPVDEDADERSNSHVRRPSSDARLRETVVESFPLVFRALVRLGVPRADAEDAAQQVFMVLAKKLDSVEVGSERAFLFATAVRIAWRARRTHRRRRETEEPPDSRVDPSPPVDEALDRARATVLLERILEEMPFDLRTVFVLFEIEQLTMSEIAGVLGLAPGTVASRLRRAREAFRAGALGNRSCQNLAEGVR